MGWTVVLPVKRLAVAKSRLRGALPATEHAGLVLSMARSTVTAAAACPLVDQVLVVTSDPTVRAFLAGSGGAGSGDTSGGAGSGDTSGGAGSGDTSGGAGSGDTASGWVASSRGGPYGAVTSGGVGFVGDPGGGLNAALRHAARLAPTSRGVAALTADIPALRPGELALALARCAVRSFVPDQPGTGTVLLAAPAGVPLDPHFGPGSASAHEASGAVRLDGDWPTLRRDVDTADDLAAAYALGWTAPRYPPED